MMVWSNCHPGPRQVGNGSARLGALLLALCLFGDVPSQVAVAGAPSGEAGSSSEQQAVLATVERFFSAMLSRDVDTWKEILLPDGKSRRFARDAQGNWRMRSASNPEDIERLSAGEGRWEERMYDPIVHIRGPMAVVWTPYTFHLDGTFSHCGIDAFSLVKLDGAWHMADAMWTVEREGCDAWMPEGSLTGTQ
jgi:hypothetical protein